MVWAKKRQICGLEIMKKYIKKTIIKKIVGY